LAANAETTMGTRQGDSDDNYRDLLSKTAQESQSDYDKAVLTLSGGALGVSIAFVKDIIGSDANYDGWLLAAWLLWGVSCASVLISYYTSAMALRKEISDFDADPERERLFSLPDLLTNVLNAVSGSCFLCGLFCFCWFASGNLSARMDRPNEPQPPREKVEKGQPLTARPSRPPLVITPSPPPPPAQPPEQPK
jgi:hypothetical protein